MMRQLRKDLWFSATVIGVLALGIGANTSGFAVINAAFLRGLPFPDGQQLHVLSWINQSGRRVGATAVELAGWRNLSRTFSGIAGYDDRTANISDDRALPEQARATFVTSNLFAILQQPPLLGRDFTIADERAVNGVVVILSHDFWRARYASDPGVLGSAIRVDGRPATIVGVMPAGMKFPDQSDLWLPLDTAAATSQRVDVFGRMTAAADRRQAQAEFDTVARSLIAADPEGTKNFVRIRVETFQQATVGGMGRTMFITMMVAVSFVLAIACANVASLLLLRSATRAREMSLRAAMGATRGRLMRQLLLESLMFAVLGAIAGLLVASAALEGLRMIQPGLGLPYWITFTMDYTVFGFVAAICVLISLVFGLAPALHLSKTNSSQVMKDGGKGAVGTLRVRRFGAAMVVIQTSLTLVLLVGAGLLLRSFNALYSFELGFDADRMVTMQVQLPAAKYATADARRAFFAELEPRVAAVPGVAAASITTGVPPLDGGERLLETDAQPADAGPRHVSTVTITPAFFDVIGIGVVRGREFGQSDGAPGNETVIINERLAEQYFPGTDPIGRHLRFTTRQPIAGQPPESWRQIVGIAGPIPHGSPQDQYLNAVVYIPYRQEAPASAALLLRSALPPTAVMQAVAREVQRIDPDQPLVRLQTLSEVLANDRRIWTIFSSIFGVFAVIALMLSAAGLYAVVAYAVAQRSAEIGVRIALGAAPGSILRLVLGRSLVHMAIGIAVGLVGAFVIGDILRGMLIGIGPSDPITYAGIAVALAITAVAAGFVPTRRALQVDPLDTLRAD